MEIINVTIPAWLYYSMSVTFAVAVSVTVMCCIRAIEKPRRRK